MFITLLEIFDITLMTLIVGFVFMTSFKPVARKTEDILEKYMKKASSRFDWQGFWFAAMVTAPALILHEFGHKFTALSFGLSAEFHAAYFWLAIAVFLRLINFSFIFFVPAYVTIIGASNPQHTLIAFAGPAVNLVLFVIALIILKIKKDLSSNAIHFWGLTKNINLFLFVFNMIPIPMFDGFQVFSGLWEMRHLVGL
jgi:Zn-dependent protease